MTIKFTEISNTNTIGSVYMVEKWSQKSKKATQLLGQPYMYVSFNFVDRGDPK